METTTNATKTTTWQVKLSQFGGYGAATVTLAQIERALRLAARQ